MFEKLLKITFKNQENHLIINSSKTNFFYFLFLSWSVLPKHLKLRFFLFKYTIKRFSLKALLIEVEQLGTFLVKEKLGLGWAR